LVNRRTTENMEHLHFFRGLPEGATALLIECRGEIKDVVPSSSSSISSLLHSHVNLEWCDKIKLSNLLLGPGTASPET